MLLSTAMNEWAWGFPKSPKVVFSTQEKHWITEEPNKINLISVLIKDQFNQNL